MTLELKLRKVGNSVGAVFSKDACSMLNAKVGDTLFLTKDPNGARITAADPEFAKQMKIAEKGMRRYRNALRELAK